MPKYIGPYKVTKTHPKESRYTLELPPEFVAQRIHPLFHVSRLHHYNKNDDSIFPKREVHAYYDFSDAEDNKWLVDNIIAHQWKGNNVSFLVQWNLGDTTWEPYAECKELVALDQYLELLGIDDEDWKKLPRKSSTTKRQMSQSSNAKAPTRRVTHKRT